MARLVSCFLLLLLLNIRAGNELFSQQQTPVGATPEARGDWLAHQIEHRDRGRDVRMAMRMRLVDRQHRQRERALTLIGLRGGPGRPVPGNRTLVRFTYPNDIKGTGFLVWEQPTGEDDRFLYLPSLGRVRRIAGSETQESFVGSDFTYEDIGGREIEDYRYRLIDPSEGAARDWTDSSGVRHPVYVLESRSKADGARFPRVVSLVRQDAMVVVHAEIHNRRDEIQKTFDVRQLDKVSGFWTEMAMTMVDKTEGSCTDLAVEQVEYNVGLKPDDFSRRALEIDAASVRAPSAPGTALPAVACDAAGRGKLQGSR